MWRYFVWLSVFFLLKNEAFALEDISRQKRCIVIQKQNGGPADNPTDDEDYDFKRPQPKNPGLDRLQSVIKGIQKTMGNVEMISPELLNLRKPPNLNNMDVFRQFINRLRNYFQ